MALREIMRTDTSHHYHYSLFREQLVTFARTNETIAKISRVCHNKFLRVCTISTCYPQARQERKKLRRQNRRRAQQYDDSLPFNTVE
eukprot:750854-Hanusia_phi.AAC.2